MNIVLLGAPGSGKGTQAERICAEYNVPHISTGEIFRYHIKRMTPIGVIAKSYIDKGNLVPDEITIKIVEERLKQQDCANGYVLDGFPRTINQAVELDKVATLDVVLNLDIDTDKLLKRLTGRRMCSSCGAGFHIDFIGDTTACPKCNGKLYIRDDDNEATVKSRLEVYANQTAALIDYYKEKGLLKNVMADGNIDDIFEGVKKVLR